MTISVTDSFVVGSRFYKYKLNRYKQICICLCAHTYVYGHVHTHELIKHVSSVEVPTGTLCGGRAGWHAIIISDSAKSVFNMGHGARDGSSWHPVRP